LIPDIVRAKNFVQSRLCQEDTVFVMRWQVWNSEFQ